MAKLERHHKEIIRYIIVALVMGFTYQMSMYAYVLEQDGKLTMQFAGVTASTYAALTLVLKYVFHTKVSE